MTLPASLSQFDAATFDDCNNLEQINVDKANPYYSSIDGIVYNKDATLLIKCPSTRTSVDIPEGVTVIGEKAFFGCSPTDMNLPSTLKEIGAFAFAGCNISEINLPNSLETIRNNAFGGNSLSEINLPTSLKEIGNEAFYNNDLTEVHIPASVEKIGTAVFAANPTDYFSIDEANANYTVANGMIFTKDMATIVACPQNKTSAVLPQTVTKIEESAFSETNIESVTMPNSITEIGAYAFYGCRYLKGATIPDGVKEIKVGTFMNCPEMTTLTISRSVEYIADGAFSDCNTLQTVYSLNPEPPVLENGGYYYSGPWPWDLSQTTLYVPQGSLAAYQGAEGWNVFSRMLELDPTAIDAAEAGGVEISATSGGIAISGAAEGLPVSVYDEGGRLAFSGTATGGTLYIPAAKGHIYIIKVGGEILKVAM